MCVSASLEIPKLFVVGLVYLFCVCFCVFVVFVCVCAILKIPKLFCCCCYVLYCLVVVFFVCLFVCAMLNNS